MMERNMRAVNLSRCMSLQCQSNAKYEKLKDLSSNTNVNVYGYIVSFEEKSITSKGRLHTVISISDETIWPLNFRVHIFYYARDCNVHFVERGIVRIFSVEVEKFGNSLDGRTFTTKNILVFDANEMGAFCCNGVSQVVTLTDEDRQIAKELWLKFNHLKLQLSQSVLENKLNGYKKLSDLKPSPTTVNIYGYVTSIQKRPVTSRGKHHVILTLVDETQHLKKFRLNIFSKQEVSCIEPGNIVRVHKMRVEDFDGSVDGRIFSSGDMAVFKHERSGSCSTPGMESNVTELDKYCAKLLWNEFNVETADSIAQILYPGWYSIKCQVLSKQRIHSECHAVLVTDGSIHPYVQLEVHNVNDAYNILEVDNVVVFERVEVTEVKNQRGKSLIFFVDCVKCPIKILLGSGEEAAVVRWGSYQQRQEKGLLPLEIEIKLSRPMYHPIYRPEICPNILDDSWDTALLDLQYSYNAFAVNNQSKLTASNANRGQVEPTLIKSPKHAIKQTYDARERTGKCQNQDGDVSICSTKNSDSKEIGPNQKTDGAVCIKKIDFEEVCGKNTSEHNPEVTLHVGGLSKSNQNCEANRLESRPSVSVDDIVQVKKKLKMNTHETIVQVAQTKENEMEVVEMQDDDQRGPLQYVMENCYNSENVYDHLSLEISKYTPLSLLNASTHTCSICAFIVAVQKEETSSYVSYHLSLVDESLLCGEVFHLQLQYAKCQIHPQPEVNQIICVSQMKVKEGPLSGIVECPDHVVLFQITPNDVLDYRTSAKIVTLTESDGQYVRNLWSKIVSKNVPLEDISSSGFYNIQCQVISLKSLSDKNPVLYVIQKSLYRSSQKQKRGIGIHLVNVTNEFCGLKGGDVVNLSRVRVTERICMEGNRTLRFQLNCSICQLNACPTTFSTGIYTYTYLTHLKQRDEPYNIYGFVMSVLKEHSSLSDVYLLSLIDEQIGRKEVLQLRLQCSKALSCAIPAVNKIIRIHNLHIKEAEPLIGIVAHPDRVVVFTVSEHSSIDYQTSAKFITLTGDDEEHLRHLWKIMDQPWTSI